MTNAFTATSKISPHNLEGKVALVTGASSGIGRPYRALYAAGLREALRQTAEE